MNFPYSVGSSIRSFVIHFPFGKASVTPMKNTLAKAVTRRKYL
jgi:hypothetical protein